MTTTTATTELEALLAERAGLADQIARTADAEVRRSLAARKAHLTRKINKAQQDGLQPAPQPAPTAVLDATAPMPPAAIVARTEQLLEQHGLAAKGWNVKLSNIMTKTYGCCDYSKREIRIAARVAALNPATETENTILHELAHALAPVGAGHGPVWKRIAREVGAKPERCHQAKTVDTPKRYRGVCEACGQVVGSRTVPPKPYHKHYHKPSACDGSGKGWIRWEDTRR